MIGKVIEPSPKITWPFVFGFIIGDGYLSGGRAKSRNAVSITVGLKKKPILEQILQFFVEQGYKKDMPKGVYWKVIPPKGNKKEKYLLRIENKKFAQFLVNHGFNLTWKAKDKELPESVWSMTIQEQRDFMEGLWLSDGTRVKGSEKNLNMKAIKLLQQVQVLISGFGYDSKIDKNGQLRVCWREFDSHPQRKYPRAAIDRQVKDVHTWRYTNINQGITDRRCYINGGDVSQYVAERMVEVNGKGPKLYRYDTVTSIEVLDKEEETYTMSVDDPMHQFVADGVITNNSSFHCLLWSAIEIQKYLDNHKMKTKLINEIHDCLIADVPESELQEYLYLARKVMVNRCMKHFPWIIVPLEIEAEVTPEGGTWFSKQVWEDTGSEWRLKQ